MILEEVMNKFIRDTINSILDIDGYAVRARQDAPRPKSNYASVDFVSDTGLGVEQYRYEDGDVEENINIVYEGTREVMYSIIFYRNGAIDHARKVRTALRKFTIQDLFCKANLNLQRISDVRQISEILENGHEERAQFDMFLNVNGSDIDVIPAILKANLSVEIHGTNFKVVNQIEVI